LIVPKCLSSIGASSPEGWGASLRRPLLVPSHDCRGCSVFTLDPAVGRKALTALMMSVVASK
jgi:hypothetical protein